MIEIRQLSTLEELDGALRLQQEVWGFADIEALPLRWFVVTSKVGGQVLGAYDGAQMVAFCAAIPGIKANGKPYLHSHMLAVLPEYRNRGIGAQMKFRQREDALARGIDLIEWTFDPLELKNAHFNIERLGAIARRYVENQYGVTASPLHGGLPTDRLIAEWHLKVGGRPLGPHARPESAPISISFPSDIARLRAEHPARAREIQRANGEKFREAFARGFAVTRFEQTGAEGVYVLEPLP